MKTININLGNNSYKVFISKNIFDEIAKFHKINYLDCNAIIVTDTNLEKYYLKKFIQNFKKKKIIVKEFIIAAGEKSKSFKSFEMLANKILRAGINRNDIIYSLGGGVVGDITGFLSSVLLRGIRFVQVPTTLLSQVDSSVGGKTGINTKIGKNLIGSFFQPNAVFIDPNTLKTLPKREFLSGYAEVVKYSLINDKKFFHWLDKNFNQIYNLKSNYIAKVISTCVKKKALIVKLDEKENNIRMLLNLGHTFAHSIEKELKYLTKHGEAVSIGMCMAMKLSNLLKYSSSNDYNLLENHLKKAHLPIRLSQLSIKKDWNVNKILCNMYSDKKVITGKLQFILCKGIGNAFVKNNISEIMIKNLIKTFIN